MDLKSLRTDRGLSLDEMARELGLRSKGYLSDLENKPGPIPRGVALRVYEKFGARVGPLESLTTDEIGLLLKLERAA